MMVYRLSRGKYKYDLSGKGAEMAGGRWNSKGVDMLYTSESIALCAVEIAVHMPLGIVPADYYLIKIQLPDEVAMKEHPLENLPADWNSFPHASMTQEIGDTFVMENEYLIMKVPSATVQGTFNYLINPRHKNFAKVTLIDAVPFAFDKRLFVKE